MEKFDDVTISWAKGQICEAMMCVRNVQFVLQSTCDNHKNVDTPGFLDGCKAKNCPLLVEYGDGEGHYSCGWTFIHFALGALMGRLSGGKPLVLADLMRMAFPPFADKEDTAK